MYITVSPVKCLMLSGRHYAERYPVGRYADEANLSVRHFSKIIHNYTGQTPMQWIISYTVNQAKRLLSQTELSVKEIAEKLGFPEQFTFRFKIEG